MSNKICFIDFEASSLCNDSFPTEIGWAFPFGHSISFLIQPEPEWIKCEIDDADAEWIGWSSKSEVVTGISQSMLLHQGVEAKEAIHRFLADTKDAKLYSDAPRFDQNWLNILLDTTGVKDRPELFDFETIYQEVAEKPDHPNMSEAIYIAEQECPHIHRAEDDARNLARIYELLHPQAM